MNPANREFRLKGNRSGAAYVIALTTLLVGITFSLAMLHAASSYYMTEKAQGQKQIATDLAEAGVDYAYWKVVKSSLALPYNATVTLTSGSFQVNAVNNGMGTMLITSTGTSKGTQYTIRRVTKGSPIDIIVDNRTGFSGSSNWYTGTMSPDKYGSDYRWRATQQISDLGVFTINLPVAGNYDVYAWWTVGSNRVNGAPYFVNYNGGQARVVVNQQYNGGKWNKLGRWNFNAGNNTVTLSCWTTLNYVVIADAIRFVGPY